MEITLLYLVQQAWQWHELGMHEPAALPPHRATLKTKGLRDVSFLATYCENPIIGRTLTAPSMVALRLGPIDPDLNCLFAPRQHPDVPQDIAPQLSSFLVSRKFQ